MANIEAPSGTVSGFSSGRCGCFRCGVAIQPECARCARSSVKGLRSVVESWAGVGGGPARPGRSGNGRPAGRRADRSSSTVRRPGTSSTSIQSPSPSGESHFYSMGCRKAARLRGRHRHCWRKRSQRLRVSGRSARDAAPGRRAPAMTPSHFAAGQGARMSDHGSRGRGAESARQSRPARSRSSASPTWQVNLINRLTQSRAASCTRRRGPSHAIARNPLRTRRARLRSGWIDTGGVDAAAGGAYGSEVADQAQRGDRRRRPRCSSSSTLDAG